MEYTRALELKGRFVLIIWPEHCLVGSRGQKVVPSLASALQEWCDYNNTSVEYLQKGLNNLTEMYSAIAADVPLDSDPSTHINRPFLARLNQSQKLYICGQALSHCVNFTMRDVLANWSREHKNLHLLEDCCSAVPGFEENATTFVGDMRQAGCTVTSSEVSLTPSNYGLLIIDPQVDFHPGGSLAIPTADNDSMRTAAFIRANISTIDRIFVTLDTHNVS